jgi:hypothetical protein
MAFRHEFVVLRGVDGTPIARAGVGVWIRHDDGAAAGLESLDQRGRVSYDGRLRRGPTDSCGVVRLCGRLVQRGTCRHAWCAGHGRVSSVVEVVAATLGQGRGPSAVPA